jgi:hypothetical protein
MAEVHIDELERAIVLLKMRANDQKQRLKEEDLPDAVAAAVRDSLRNIYDNIYRMSAVRDAMNVREPYGCIH